MLNSVPKRSGIYFVKDNINNLQFKISFRTINTLLNLPKYGVPSYNNKSAVKARKTNGNSPSEDEKVVIIKWQQKLFSYAECELFGDLMNCNNDQHRKYHEILKEKERETKVTRKKRQRRREKSENVPPNGDGNFIFTYVNEDNFQAQNDWDKNMDAKMKHCDREPFEQMFVYAALKPDIQLAVLRWFKRERLLYIYPDFTDYQNQPYFIQIDSDYRHLYAYGIEDISLKDLSSQEQEQFLYLPEMPTHWRLEDELGKKFSMPPRNTQRCAIILSLTDAVGFEYDNVHVRYHITLPVNTILEEGLLDAASHSASSSSTYSPLHIGLTWQITVLCEEQFDPSQNLHIFFEIISIDTWERERLEGFAHFSLHLLQPCRHTLQLSCTRPVETTLESVARYFIGGRRKFDYVNFICDQEADEGEGASNFYCRYGQRMQNSGQLSLSYEILTQRSCELLNPCASRTSGMTLDDIMMAYKEARRRLEAVTLN